MKIDDKYLVEGKTGAIQWTDEIENFSGWHHALRTLCRIEEIV